MMLKNGGRAMEMMVMPPWLFLQVGQRAMNRKIRCCIKYCAYTLELDTKECQIEEANYYGWKYISAWEPNAKNTSGFICPECWEQSGLKFRT
jgi:hypothetical protein